MQISATDSENPVFYDTVGATNTDSKSGLASKDYGILLGTIHNDYVGQEEIQTKATRDRGDQVVESSVTVSVGSRSGVARRQAYQAPQEENQLDD